MPHKKETRGRPKLPKGEAKSETVRVRVTPTEYKSIVSKAGKDGVSEWARDVMLLAVSRA